MKSGNLSNDTGDIPPFPDAPPEGYWESENELKSRRAASMDKVLDDIKHLSPWDRCLWVGKFVNTASETRDTFAYEYFSHEYNWLRIRLSITAALWSFLAVLFLALFAWGVEYDFNGGYFKMTQLDNIITILLVLVGLVFLSTVNNRIDEERNYLQDTVAEFHRTLNHPETIPEMLRERHRLQRRLNASERVREELLQAFVEESTPTDPSEPSP